MTEIELKEEATEKLKIQMKEFGSLRSYPKFKKIVLTIKFNKDFYPILRTQSAFQKE